jgi:hypothetical protein
LDTITDGTPARIWYQSFTDPDVDAPYFRRLSDYIQSITASGFESVVHGIHRAFSRIRLRPISASI